MKILYPDSISGYPDIRILYPDIRILYPKLVCFGYHFLENFPFAEDSWYHKGTSGDEPKKFWKLNTVSANIISLEVLFYADLLNYDFLRDFSEATLLSVNWFCPKKNSLHSQPLFSKSGRSNKVWAGTASYHCFFIPGGRARAHHNCLKAVVMKFIIQRWHFFLTSK